MTTVCLQSHNLRSAAGGSYRIMADASARSVVPSLLPDALHQRALQQLAAAERSSEAPPQMPDMQQAADSGTAAAGPATELPALQNLTIQGQGYGEGSRRQSRAHDSSGGAGPGHPGCAQRGHMEEASGQEDLNNAGDNSAAVDAAGQEDVCKDERSVVSLPEMKSEEPYHRQAGAQKPLTWGLIGGQCPCTLRPCQICMTTSCCGACSTC